MYGATRRKVGEESCEMCRGAKTRRQMTSKLATSMGARQCHLARNGRGMHTSLPSATISTNHRCAVPMSTAPPASASSAGCSAVELPSADRRAGEEREALGRADLEKVVEHARRRAHWRHALPRVARAHRVALQMAQQHRKQQHDLDVLQRGVSRSR
eukprot:900502-Pleurochrysis_carterae.AAC.1